MALNNRKIAFIGAGHITNILLDNLTRAKKISSHLPIVSDPDKYKLQQLGEKHKIEMAHDNSDATNKGDFIFINVPPQVAGNVIAELSQKPFPKNKLIISLAAGISINTYDRLGNETPIVRALPNPPSQVGMGIAALCFNAYVNDEQKKDVFELFSSLGEYVVLREEHINAITSLSSPAATYLFFQSLIDAGVRAGIDNKTSTKIVYQTIVGAMEVWKQRQVSPNELLSEASTPGGISIESIFTLERYSFRAALNEAINQGASKAQELGDAVQNTETRRPL
ncbi:MAG: pyrroline-5-carboxylate reductase [Deltaproteobacteria bacterium]|nr:pyrroline-5-carboxylate reductase [Deltaproteobacteria bacterium]